MSNAEFFQRLAEMLANVVEAGANNAVLHYMPADSLKYLVGPSAEIACSSLLYQDEPNEIMAGARRFIDWLAGDAALPAAHREALCSKIAALVRERASSYPRAPYVFCLTDRKDEPAYWCRHAKDGGFAVAFDKKALHERIDAANAPSAGSSSDGRLMFLMPVLCPRSDSQHIPLFFDLLYGQRRDAFDRYAKGAPSADCNEVLAQILVAAAIVRGEDLANRREWRLVLLPTAKDVAEARDRQAKVDKRNPKPRLDTGIQLASGDLREIVRCIYVSPQGDRDKLRSQLVNRLRALPSQLTGDEVVADGLLFVRNSAHTAANLCSQCAEKLTCPNKKPDAVPKPRDASRGNGSQGVSGRVNGGWNRPSSGRPTAKMGDSKKNLAWGVLFGLLAAVAAIAIYYFTQDVDKPAEKRPDKKTQPIPKVKPAPGPKPNPQPARPEPAKPKPKPVEKPSWERPMPAGLSEGEQEIWRRRAKYEKMVATDKRLRRFLDKQLENHQKPLYKSGVEQVLDWIFTAKVGDQVPPPLPNMSGFELNHIEDILDSVNEIKDDDDAKTAERKRIVDEVKKELKQYLKDGGKLQDFLEHYRAQLETAWEAKNAAAAMIRDEVRDGKDPEGTLELVEKANKILEDKGITPVELSEEQKEALGEQLRQKDQQKDQDKKEPKE